MILIPGLTTLSGVSITVSAANPFPLDQYTALTDDQITVDGVTLTLTKATDIDGSSLYVENGGTLTLPNVTTYSSTGSSGSTFEASDSGSLLSLPGLTTITTDDGIDSRGDRRRGRDRSRELELGHHQPRASDG